MTQSPKRELTCLLFCVQAPSRTIVSSFAAAVQEAVNQGVLADGKPKGLTGYLNLISQRATIQGFLMYVHAAGAALSSTN